MKALTKFTFLILLGLSIGLISCSKEESDDSPQSPTAPSKSLAELVQEKPQFSILSEALIKTELFSEIEDAVSLTFFAPNNEAFVAFFDENEITDDNGDGSRLDDAFANLGDTLTHTLLYHMINERISSSDLNVAKYKSTMCTFSPDSDPLTVRVALHNNTVIVNGGIGIGGIVLDANINATNGIIHELDGILVMPNVVDHAIANPELSELVNAVVTTNSWNSLCPLASLTIFAPLNSAFEDRSSTMEEYSTEQITEILGYHVLETQVHAEDISAGDELTYIGQYLTIELSPDGTRAILTDAVGEKSTVVLTNLQATNGVVHIIDGVLLPSL
ncbi:MAG: fasciclin domain-containing protein [Cryomorphaceae bacterium]